MYMFNDTRHGVKLYQRDGVHLAEVEAYEGGASPFGGTVSGTPEPTLRKRARRAIKAYHGEGGDVARFLGWTPYYRRADGATRRARIYEVTIGA